MQPLTHQDLNSVAALKEIAGYSSGWAMLLACPLRELDPGDVLLYAGQANDRMYFVLDGLLSVRLTSKTSDPVATIEPGGAVGELSVIDQNPASAFVVAEEPTRLIMLDQHSFWRLVKASPAFSRHVITSVASQVRRSTASLVRTLDANSNLEASAMIDSLTGVYNRRWLTERVERLLARAWSDRAPFSLFMIDVDLFKKFNDTFGHPAGDAVLVAVAQAAANSVRPTDFVARYGGEEFLVVLPGTNLVDALIVAERTRQAISQVEVRGTDGSALPTVTVSIGVAELVDEGELAPLIVRADTLLYAAKKNGRNRVEA